MGKTVDIFLRTYERDYPWLEFLWRSIALHQVAGFRRVVIVHPPNQPGPPPPPIPHLIVPEDRVYPNDYAGQMITKLRAGGHTDADEVVYVDSDCVFITPVDFQTWQYPLLCTPWEQVPDAKAAWYEQTKTLLGFEPPFETMRRFPFVYPADFVREVYAHIGGVERCLSLLADYKIQGMSEFNVLGNYAIVKCPEKFHVQRTDLGPFPPDIVHQFWSYSTVHDPKVRGYLVGLGLL